jgi:hypothetical protein
VRHGHILLSLTPAELHQAEAVARQHPQAAVYLWRDGQWLAFPGHDQPDYRAPVHSADPRFDPTGWRPPSPSSGERAPAVSRIIAERGPGERGERACWWLSGDTWPHRDVLRQHGARFSGQRKAWYYHGAELPAAIRRCWSSRRLCHRCRRRTIRCTLAEAAAILGVRMTEAPAPAPPRLFALHDTAYARYDLETAEGTPIPTGTRGSVVRLYQHNARHGWSCEVAFEGVGPCWAFERELTPHAPIPGVRITRGAVVPPGAQPPPTDAEIRRALIEDGLKPAPEDGIVEPALRRSKPGIAPRPSRLSNRQTRCRPSQPPRQRRHRPPSASTGPRRCQPKASRWMQCRPPSASSRAQPPVAAGQSAALTRGRLARIEQAFVGELSGSITGQVFCYGYALHDGLCVYVNMAGPRVAVEAIRARLSKGDIVTVVPPDAPAVELTAGRGQQRHVPRLPARAARSALRLADPGARLGGHAELRRQGDHLPLPHQRGAGDRQAQAARHAAGERAGVRSVGALPVRGGAAGDARPQDTLGRRHRSAQHRSRCRRLDAPAYGGLEQRIIRLPQGTV